MGKRGRANLALVGAVGAVGDKKDAELALRRLDRGIDFTRGDAVALGIKLKVVNGRLHRAFHFAAQWWDDLAVLDRDRTLTVGPAQLLHALSHDAHGLAHLLHPHQVAIVAVAILPDWD